MFLKARNELFPAVKKTLRQMFHSNGQTCPKHERSITRDVVISAAQSTIHTERDPPTTLWSGFLGPRPMSSSELNGGAYVLNSLDILALASLIVLAVVILRKVRGRLEKPSIGRAKAQ